MRVFIAEKPELAKAIVEGLGGGKRLTGYFECPNGDAVTWCYGHMLRLMDPEEHDPKYARWSLADLPIPMSPWRKAPIDRKGSSEQLKIIIDLLKKSDSAVHAGDPDDEGQLLIDEILEHVKYRKPVKRLLVNDNNTKVVRKALASMRDNAEFANLSAAAEARAVADQIYGYNMTRTYTLVAQKAGHQGTLNVGRVQTPILGMVVRRTRAFRDHKKAHYFVVTGHFSISGVGFPAKYVVADGDQVDEKRRLVDETAAKAIASAAKGSGARIIEARTRSLEQPPPLPYNLLKLQADASKKYGIRPDETKDITQNLREKHRLITYNRSDCQYLSDEQHEDAPGVLSAIAGTARDLMGEAVRGANPALKSRAFDSSKVSAHHAIIPTETVASLASLTDAERKVYLLIARAYIAQFYPPRKYDQTVVLVEASGKRFSATANFTTSRGWTALYGAEDADDGDESSAPDEITMDLRSLRAGDAGMCKDATVEQKETKPQPLYTLSSLMLDLPSVAKYVKDERLRKLLIDKDKGKEGEHGGIGTPATRDTIIKGLIDRGFLVEKGKNIISSEMAEKFYDVLPDQAKFPDMTALWHEQQNEIRAGKLTTVNFIASLSDAVAAEVSRVIKDGLNIGIEAHSSPKAGCALRRIKRKDGGFFWGCAGRQDGCDYTCNDDGGRPHEGPVSAPGTRKGGGKPAASRAGSASASATDAPKAPARHAPASVKCPDCGGRMIERQSARGSFYGCAAFPKCRGTAQIAKAASR